MDRRAFTLALFIAAISVFIVYTYVDDKEKSLKKKFGVETSVVLAKVDIKELELIDDSKVVIKSVPESFAAPGHFKSIKEVENTIAAVPILKDEQITRPRIAYPGMKTGLSRQVSNGKRAVAIIIDDRSSVSKLIKPGDRVDMLVALDPYNGRKDKQFVQTILQDVLVLSTGYNITNSLPIVGMEQDKVIKQMNLNTYNNYNTVSLELDPYEVQRLFFIQQFTQSYFLSLRNNSDKNVVRVRPTNLYDLMGEDAQELKAFFAEKYK
jgi:pilus assembly protein CpaB